MSNDQKMIISVLNSLKVMNVRFRGDDITDAIRDQLRPLMVRLDKQCIAYIRLLREPETMTSTEELNLYRTIVKEIKIVSAIALPAKTVEIVEFIETRIQENRADPAPPPLPSDSDEEEDSTAIIVHRDSDSTDVLVIVVDSDDSASNEGDNGSNTDNDGDGDHNSDDDNRNT